MHGEAQKIPYSFNLWLTEAQCCYYLQGRQQQILGVPIIMKAMKEMIRSVEKCLHCTVKYHSLDCASYQSLLIYIKGANSSRADCRTKCSLLPLLAVQMICIAVTRLCLWSSTHVLIYWVLYGLHTGCMRRSDCMRAEVQTSSRKTNSICQTNSSERKKERERHPPCVPLKETLIKTLLFVWALPLRPVCILVSHKPKPLLYRVILIDTLYSFPAFFPFNSFVYSCTKLNIFGCMINHCLVAWRCA